MDRYAHLRHFSMWLISARIAGSRLCPSLCPCLIAGTRSLARPFTELDSPLIEGIDAPDDPLDEDLVLIERDELAERARIDPWEDDQVTRLVARCSLCGRSRSTSSELIPSASSCSRYLSLILTLHERLGLRGQLAIASLVLLRIAAEPATGSRKSR